MLLQSCGLFHVELTGLEKPPDQSSSFLQICQALANIDKKELMKKLPRFIYDEEKALEKTRKMLSAKIEELNRAIDEASIQIRTQDKVKLIQPKEGK